MRVLLCVRRRGLTEPGAPAVSPAPRGYRACGTTTCVDATVVFPLASLAW
jgi:hypothetical protein